MRKNLLRFKSAALLSLESKYFITFCIISTLFLTIIKQFAIDLCMFGFLDVKSCLVFRNSNYKHEGYYSFGTFNSYLVVLILFLVLMVTIAFFSNERVVMKSTSLKKRFFIFLLIPFFSFFFNFFILSIIYLPPMKQITHQAVIDCCKGKIISPWGEIDNIDTRQRFCENNRRSKENETKCLFPLEYL